MGCVNVQWNGIYNLEMAQTALLEGFTAVSFNTDPLAFNFCPEKEIKNIISCFPHKLQWVFQIANQPDFSVIKIQEYMAKEFPQADYVFEFEGLEQKKYCESFKTPYHLEIHSQRTWQSFLTAEYCQAFVIKESYIQKLLEEKQFFELAKELKERCLQENKKLYLQWDLLKEGPIKEASFLNLSGHHLQSTPYFETSYRQFDFEGLRGFLPTFVKHVAQTQARINS